MKKLTLIALLSFLTCCFNATAQNTENNNESKGYLGLGAGAILHLGEDSEGYGIGINSSIEGNYSIFPYLGITGQIGFNKIQVSSRDEIYLLLENAKYQMWYNTIESSNIDSEPGMNIGYIIGGPSFTFPAGKVNFDFIPKAGVAFGSPFYQYEYTIAGYSIAGYYDKDIVLYEGNYTTGFILDIELALRTKLTDSGLGFKFYTKYLHSSFTHEMTRTHIYQSRDYPDGPVEQELRDKENTNQKVAIDALIVGLAVVYNF